MHTFRPISLYALVDCNPLTPLFRFVLDLSYKYFLHCYAAVGKILTDASRRLRYQRLILSIVGTFQRRALEATPLTVFVLRHSNSTILHYIPTLRRPTFCPE